MERRQNRKRKTKGKVKQEQKESKKAALQAIQQSRSDVETKWTLKWAASAEAAKKDRAAPPDEVLQGKLDQIEISPGSIGTPIFRSLRKVVMKDHIKWQPDWILEWIIDFGGREVVVSQYGPHTDL